jgi:hypothetical protein
MKFLTEACVNSFIKSFQEHPGLTLFVILATSGLLGYSLNVFADKDTLQTHIAKTNKKFQSIEMRIDQLDYAMLRRGLETEIFELERIVDRGEAREVDHKRLNQLQNQLTHAKEEMHRKLRTP